MAEKESVKDTFMKLPFLIIIALLMVCDVSEAVQHANEPGSADGAYLHQLTTTMIRVSKASHLKRAEVDTMIALFKLNEQPANRMRSYPNTEAESAAFYSAIRRILVLSRNDPTYISSIFELRFTIKKIVEWGEYLSELPSEIALTNPKGFVIAYRSLLERQRKVILGDLSIIVENGKKNEFVKSLESIKDISYTNEILEIKEYLK